MQLTKNVTIQIKLATNLVMFEKTQKGSKKKSKSCKQKHVSADARDLSKKILTFSFLRIHLRNNIHMHF